METRKTTPTPGRGFRGEDSFGDWLLFRGLEIILFTVTVCGCSLAFGAIIYGAVALYKELVELLNSMP